MKIESVPSTGINKYKKIEKMFRLIDKEEIKNILDAGGTDYTYSFLISNFPKSKIISLNMDKNEIKNVKHPLMGNVEEIGKKFKKDSFDMIFFCDTLEHLFYPEKFIEGARHALRKGGHIIITTPNLTSIYNRIFILFGLTPHNYDAVKGPVLGNPIIRDRYSGHHKSVFTHKALKEWVMLNGFEIIRCGGFHYGNKKLTFREGKSPTFRKLVNFMIPTCMKEGTVILCKKE